MNRQRNAVRAGLLIILSLLLVFTVVISIRGLSGFVEPHQIRTVCFALKDDLAGLRVGDDVRIGGYRVGDVRSITVLSADDPRLRQYAGVAAVEEDGGCIVVTFALPKKYVLREGARIGVQSTVTEKTCLNIDRLGRGRPLAPEVPLIGRPSAMGALLATLGETAPLLKSVLARADATVASINSGVEEIRPRIVAVLDDVRGSSLPEVRRTLAAWRALAENASGVVSAVGSYLHPVYERYAEVARSAREMMDQIADLAGGPTSDLRGALRNVREATAAIRDRAGPLLDELSRMLRDVQPAIFDAREALANARAASAALKDAVADNRGSLDRIMRHLEQSAENIEEVTDEVRARPWRLFYTPRERELGNLAIFDATRQFARGAAKLNDAAQALRDTARDKAQDPLKLQKMRDELEKAFQDFAKVEKQLWEAVRGR